MNNVPTRDAKRDIEVARKYNLRLLTLKLNVFRLFDEGYSPTEVSYLLRYLEAPEFHRSRSNTIRSYYSLWEKAQAPKARGNRARQPWFCISPGIQQDEARYY